MKRFPSILVICIAAVLAGGYAGAAEPIEYEPIPSSILTPDCVATRLGPLEFFDGFPDADTVAKVYDHIDFQRGVRTFLDAIPIASLYAMREGLREVGCVDGTVGIFEDLMDSKANFWAAVRVGGGNGMIF